MHDCYIRVTALLDCFEWTGINYTTGRGRGINYAINAKQLGVDFWCYKFLIFKRHVPLALNHYWYQKGA